jgi:hypothetical protein
MAISLQKIASNTANVSFQASPDPNDVVNLTYYPGRVTEKVFFFGIDFSSTEAATASLKDFNQTLANLIKNWDVYEDVEQTQLFPIDPERFPELPFELRLGIIKAIAGDVRPEAAAQTQS